MNSYLSTAIELLFGFLLLLLIIKILGKTQFSQITPFDFISALILGELVGNAAYDDGVKLGQITFAILFWGMLIYMIEWITQKYKGTRKLLEGEPNIVIHKGQIKFDALKKVKLDINALQSLIRQQGYFTIQEVDYAIVETNGMISVLPKSDYDTPKNKDLNLVTKPASLPITLILDGEVILDNLKELGLGEKWLKDQLAMQSIKEYKEVLFAEWIPNMPVYVMRYEKG
ncbi:DUF421 domain-containing protein [Aquibacillus koreensis]|uniref:DUF421 domain-containing protein n=1 Tax=Aquibacillus koreensis TaxID=279446 RepID=A0A9X3WKP2_9BACI|nr:DUF421 domain-containing protein [Aquibacillus koreensis]MCT2536769.1 DUF421 domain-containing protein [Aquibacillus koreensis]MDC3421475.1 DUF421 domain-containing protein [Aquibacillus koreensis]